MKINFLNENSSTRVKSALFGDASGKIVSFAILTPENPCGDELPSQDNNKRLESFKKLMRSMSIQYVPISGSFGGNKEHSFMLFNLTLDDAKHISTLYKQKSFFFGETKNFFHPADRNRNTASVIGYYETSSHNCADGNYRLIEESNVIEDMKDAEDFFSRHGDFKFAISMDIFESLLEIKDMSAMREAFDNSKTPRHRATRRHFAYNGKLK